MAQFIYIFQPMQKQQNSCQMIKKQMQNKHNYKIPTISELQMILNDLKMTAPTSINNTNETTNLPNAQAMQTKINCISHKQYDSVIQDDLNDPKSYDYFIIHEKLNANHKSNGKNIKTQANLVAHYKQEIHSTNKKGRTDSSRTKSNKLAYGQILSNKKKVPVLKANQINHQQQFKNKQISNKNKENQKTINQNMPTTPIAKLRETQIQTKKNFAVGQKIPIHKFSDWNLFLRTNKHKMI